MPGRWPWNYWKQLLYIYDFFHYILGLERDSYCSEAFWHSLSELNHGRISGKYIIWNIWILHFCLILGLILFCKVSTWHSCNFYLWTGHCNTKDKKSEMQERIIMRVSFIFTILMSLSMASPPADDPSLTQSWCQPNCGAKKSTPVTDART